MEELQFKWPFIILVAMFLALTLYVRRLIDRIDILEEDKRYWLIKSNEYRDKMISAHNRIRELESKKV